jgi:hypothetical protein
MTDRSAIARRSRRKGGTWERECATWLRTLLGEGWDVRRNPADRQRGTVGAGDLVVTGPHPWPWAIECKDVASIRLRHLLDPSARLVEHWRQTCDQAAPMGLRPALLAKIEGVRLVVLRRGDASQIGATEPAVRTVLDGDAVVALPWAAVERAAWTAGGVG